MSGIYIHIPFCKSRCVYCDFYTGTNEVQMQAFVNALCAEMRLRRGEIGSSVQTVYFGGGTPSRLHRAHFEQIFDALFGEFSVDAAAEITLEANPDDLSAEYIQMLAALPFNRVSIGIQSFDDHELRFLSRRHSAQQAADAVRNCQKAGFANISIDLMYGLPNQTMDIWRNNLRKAVELDIQHISAYHLIYEEKTKLHALLRQHKIQPVSDELSTDMFSALIHTLAQHGFEHYEISNFARNRLYSNHNTSYWKNVPYIGFGPAAHSFDGGNRSWNAASLTRYIRGAQSGKFERETEHLSLHQKYNEFILTGLRTVWGVNLEELKSRFGTQLHDFCVENARKFIAQRLLTFDGHMLKLTREGIFISDGIMSEMMWV